MDSIEAKILSNLIYDETYTRKVIPFIKDTYFESLTDKIVFQEIHQYVTKYDAMPSKAVLKIEIENRKDISDDAFQSSINLVNQLTEEKFDEQWLLDTTEKWCKDRAIYLALLESVKIADGKDKTRSKDSIPSILSDALSVSFDDHIGHDYISDSDSRYDFYHKKEDKIPFDLDLFNKITKGGIPNKTLNVALAGCVHPETKVKIRFRKIS